MRPAKVLLGLLGALLMAQHAAHGQAAAPKLEFEVASIRPSGPQSSGPMGARQWKNGGAGTPDPARLTYTLMPLRMLLMDAYGVKPDQIIGPGIDERYDVAAKIPMGTTPLEQNLMLRSLLIERFHMSVREEVREMPGYVLTMAKGGAKLKE